MLLENVFPNDERVEKEALSLIKAGHNVSLLCPTFSDDEVGEQYYKGIKIIRVKINNFLYKKARPTCLVNPFYFRYWRNKISDVLSKNSFDVLHIHDLPLAKIGVYAQKKYNIKFVLDSHENYPYMLETSSYSNTFLGKLFVPINKWKRYEKHMLAKADSVVVVCDEMGERMSSLASNKYYTLENTIGLEMFPKPQNIKNTDSKIRILYVGGVTIHRGLQIVVRGLSLLEDKSNIELVILGKGAYLPELKKQIKDCGIENMVSFPEYLSFPEDAYKIGKYDIGIIPHLKSIQTDCSSPNKIFHYFYYGLPVIVSDFNSIKGIIKESGDGIIYRNDSPEDFRDKLLVFIKKNLKELGEKGYNYVIDKKNWEVSVQELIRLYDEISSHK